METSYHGDFLPGYFVPPNWSFFFLLNMMVVNYMYISGMYYKLVFHHVSKLGTDRLQLTSRMNTNDPVSGMIKFVK